MDEHIIASADPIAAGSVAGTSDGDADRDEVLAEYGKGAGIGMITGFLASGGAHPTYHAPFVLMTAFCYGLFVAPLTGWTELVALLTLAGATVLYWGAVELIGLDSLGLPTRLGLVLAAFAALLGYVVVVVLEVHRARTRARERAAGGAADVRDDQDRWEGRYYAALRARSADDRPSWPLLLRPFAWIALLVALYAGLPLAFSTAP